MNFFHSFIPTPNGLCSHPFVQGNSHLVLEGKLMRFNEECGNKLKNLCFITLRIFSVGLGNALLSLRKLPLQAGGWKISESLFCVIWTCPVACLKPSGLCVDIWPGAELGICLEEPKHFKYNFPTAHTQTHLCWGYGAQFLRPSFKQENKIGKPRICEIIPVEKCFQCKIPFVRIHFSHSSISFYKNINLGWFLAVTEKARRYKQFDLS